MNGEYRSDLVNSIVNEINKNASEKAEKQKQEVKEIERIEIRKETLANFNNIIKMDSKRRIVVPSLIASDFGFSKDKKDIEVRVTYNPDTKTMSLQLF